MELAAAMPFLLKTGLRRLGAEFDGGPDLESNVATDGRFVAGRNPASATDAARAVIELTAERDPAEYGSRNSREPVIDPGPA